MFECDICGNTYEKKRSLSYHKSHTHERRQQEEWRSEEWLTREYIEKERSLQDIADDVGYSNGTVANVMERFGIERRDKEDATRAKLRREYVTHYTSTSGYEVWKDKSSGNKSFSVHRLLAIAEFGTDSVKGKQVHHKNGIKWDNRPENLEVMTNAEHQKIHYERGDTGLTPGNE